MAAPTRAAYSSAGGYSNQIAMTIPIPAAAEVMASLRWCHASAFTAPLPVALPDRQTNRNSVSLMTMTPTRTARVYFAGTG